MNILITRFPYESAWGGEEHHTIELAKHCRDNGHDVMFAGSCKTLLKKFEDEAFPAHKVAAPKMPVTPLTLFWFLCIYPIVSIKFYLYFTGLFSDEKIDVIYCMSLIDKIILTPIAHERKIKVIWIEHQQIRNWLTKSPLKFLYQRRSKLANIIPISLWNKKKLVEEIKVRPSNIQEILNGVDHDELSPYQSHKKDTHHIGASSRLIKKKGIDILIKAFNIVIKKQKLLKLTVIGVGPEKENLQKLISRLKLKSQVKIVPQFKSRSDYLSLMSNFSYFILPSIDESETFGIVVAEAMTLRSSVIVSDAAGIANYLMDGHDAFIANRNDVVSLAEKLEEAIKDNGQICSQSLKTAQDKFDEDKSYDQYLKLFMS
jgi:glycosyltransferase involved in cell wall biosynthesis